MVQGNDGQIFASAKGIIQVHGAAAGDHENMLDPVSSQFGCYIVRDAHKLFIRGGFIFIQHDKPIVHSQVISNLAADTQRMQR